MLEIRILSFDELTDSQKKNQPNNGAGKEYANYLHLTHNGLTLAIYSDAMEPEDTTLNRDLSWVIQAIMSAYELGKKDA